MLLSKPSPSPYIRFGILASAQRKESELVSSACVQIPSDGRFFCEPSREEHTQPKKCPMELNNMEHPCWLWKEAIRILPSFLETCGNKDCGRAFK